MIDLKNWDKPAPERIPEGERWRGVGSEPEQVFSVAKASAVTEEEADAAPLIKRRG
jgi:hypothetical protein